MRGGGHVALLGSGLRPSASRATLTKIATLVQAGQPAADNLPPALPLPRSAQLVFVSDFLSPLEDIDRALRYYGQGGQRGALLQVLDPAEESLRSEEHTSELQPTMRTSIADLFFKQ